MLVSRHHAVMIVRVYFVAMLRVVQVFPGRTLQTVFRVVVIIVGRIIQPKNVRHGRKTITALQGLALMQGVCPLMGGWGF